MLSSALCVVHGVSCLIASLVLLRPVLPLNVNALAAKPNSIFVQTIHLKPR
ncbi:hypothetical protein NDAWWUGD_CDS0159 [Salmonella phage SeKF_80]